MLVRTMLHQGVLTNLLNCIFAAPVLTVQIKTDKTGVVI